MRGTTAMPMRKAPTGPGWWGELGAPAIAGIAAVLVTALLGAAPIWATSLVVVAFLAVLVAHRLVIRQRVALTPTVSDEDRETLIKLRALLDALPQPVMLLDGELSVQMFNEACGVMFGQRLSGQHISAVVRAPQALEVIRTVSQSGEPFEAEFTWTGVQTRTSLFYAAPVAAGGIGASSPMIVMLRDRTEQRKLERMRTDFIANASHELRTPLTSMAGFIETLQNHAKDDPQAREQFLRIMAGQTERMLRLVEDLVNLSAIELNEAKAPSDALDLRSIVGSVVESLQPVAGQAAGSLVVVNNAGMEDPLPITGERLELFRLVQNLCDNALKYGESEKDGISRVSVHLGRGQPPHRDGAARTGESAAQIAVRSGVDEGRLVYVQVRDEGAGIDRTDLPRLTERFYRVNPQLSRARGGTGLGLAIVKHILQRHRGGLQIESVEGEGAWFSVMLPPQAKRAAAGPTPRGNGSTVPEDATL